MKLIQSFIAISEAAAQQQEQQKKLTPTVEVVQPTQSQELTNANVLLFKEWEIGGNRKAI